MARFVLRQPQIHEMFTQISATFMLPGITISIVNMQHVTNGENTSYIEGEICLTIITLTFPIVSPGDCYVVIT